VPKDRDGAKAQFERAAAHDNAVALYNLGVMALDSSSGRKPDYAAASRYFLRSANAGYDDGAYSYGVMLREGKGVPQDLAEGAKWLKRASDAGVIAGQVEYAIMLFNGEGVPKDQSGAVSILRMAAAKGNPIAQNRLAHLYVDGAVVGRDLAQAAAFNAFAKAGGLEDQSLDVATANLTAEERSRFTRIVRGLIAK
jgi:TPR repeat protein